MRGGHVRSVYFRAVYGNETSNRIVVVRITGIIFPPCHEKQFLFLYRLPNLILFSKNNINTLLMVRITITSI